ncbi:DUF7560 family zinc ribbon protein [Haloarcula pellucida]|uniref:DUF7560 family zinc ribbon protein n=1 Tax=Haloarcula pellucida TaxID=1427151 RepID=UPI00166D5DC6|nr:zinc ribbon domain-containing protein [Halomicroarcula pellucida]
MAEYWFTCPECGAHVAVDDGARDRLLSAGCAVCGVPVGPAAFTESNTFGTSA